MELMEATVAQSGFRLGKYEIVKRLAAGGMAEIFLARVLGLPGFQRMVVIKRILPLLANKGDFLEMFLNEARIAATLQHPNVVAMYDVGVVDGSYFIAMEYLHGEDVRRIQTAMHKENHPIPLEHALQIIIGVCSGLQYAHDKIGFDGQPLKIVHRDVSPQNVIVTYDGGIKLLDFGVAKASNSLTETRCGIVKGKIPYMSPEQCRGLPLDRRSDVYSVGIMLYELTLGRRLYGRGMSEFETLKCISERPVTPPCTIDRGYDSDLERIVMRALAKNPDRRYQTARELQLALEALARARGLYLSAIALQQFMSRTFGPRIEAWREDPPPPPKVAESPSVEVIIEWEEPRPQPVVPKRRHQLWALAAGVALLGVSAPLLAWRSLRTPYVAPPPAALVAEPPLFIVEAPPVATPPPPAVAAPPAAVAPAAPPKEPARARSLRRVVRSREEGELVLQARPWCQVVIDGASRGPTPLTVKLPAGPHIVRLSNARFGVDRTLSVDVAPRGVVRKAVVFPPSQYGR